tara:strand:- start:3580 stop:3813 length:234 start_codon:yes stop_codon:yes gene_type:complete
MEGQGQQDWGKHGISSPGIPGVPGGSSVGLPYKKILGWPQTPLQLLPTETNPHTQHSLLLPDPIGTNLLLIYFSFYN